MLKTAGGHTTFTLAGWWCALVFGPILQFAFVRWAWKFFIWVYFLYRISRAKLRLAIGHPDEAGGLGFVGSLQATFGTLIFAWGLVVLADALNQITRFTPSPTLYVSVGAFVVFAPLLFMSPLLMFTKKIYDARQEGHVHYQILLTQFTIAFEQKHLGQPVAGEEALAQMEALAGLARIETLHAHLAKMRIVPFDLVSLGHLGLSAVTPMLPLLLRVIPWPEVRHLAESLLARH